MSLASALGFVVASTTDRVLSEASIDFSSSGNNIIISATSGQGIYVYKIWFIVEAATNLTYYDGATALSGPLPFTANMSMVLDFDTRPWFEVTGGSGFIINSSNAVQVSGRVYYVKQ